MSKILIIIPSFNEKENIVSLIDVLASRNLEADILIVDDSTDETSVLVENKKKNNKHLFLIKRLTKSGRGSAVIEGFRFALARDYQKIVEMDADFSHNPDEVPILLDASSENTLVIGSRYLKKSKIVNWPLSRRVFSKLANIYAGMILNIGIKDYTNGFRVYSRDLLEKLNLSGIRGSGYIVLSEIAYQLFKRGVHFIEVPTVFVNRKRGTSNFSFKEIKEAFLSVLKIRFLWSR